MNAESSLSSDDQRYPPGAPLYEMDIVVKWGDMDALSHVNNAQYFRYFEQVRLDWYHNSGFGVLGGTACHSNRANGWPLSWP